MTLAERHAELCEQVRAQWAKFDKAQSEGVTGAPLAQIDRKLARLELERDATHDELVTLERLRSQGTIGSCNAEDFLR